MRFALDGRKYEYDSTLTVEEAMFLQDKANLGVNEVDVALAKGNPYAIAAFMFVLMKRAGVAVRWQDMLQLNIRTFEIIPDPPGDADAADDDPEVDESARPDPTGPGTTQASATTATSSA